MYKNTAANCEPHMQKKTTKHCPKCGNTKLVLLRSQNIKICPNCNVEIPWLLTEGQKKII